MRRRLDFRYIDIYGKRPAGEEDRGDGRRNEGCCEVSLRRERARGGGDQKGYV